MNSLLSRLAWGAGLCLLTLSMILAACGGAMGESAEAPGEGEPYESISTVAAPTAVPTIEPTPDFGTVAYDVPHEMVREKAVEVILLASSSEEEDLTGALEEELQEVDQAPQNVTTAQIEVARYMFATLDSAPSDAFEIVPHQSEKQELSDDEPTQWEWTVIPQKGGTHRLILRIDRVVGDGANAESFKEEVHRDEVTVEVPFSLKVRDALSGFDLKWLAGVFIFPLFFYILGRRDQEKKKEGEG
ncbi:MAG: hypothetical protein ACK2U0_13105 [Candidatus Promineifilaceae bacterium]|jgi:hypothetical protein